MSYDIVDIQACIPVVQGFVVICTWYAEGYFDLGCVEKSHMNSPAGMVNRIYENL